MCPSLSHYAHAHLEKKSILLLSGASISAKDLFIHLLKPQPSDPVAELVPIHFPLHLTLALAVVATSTSMWFHTALPSLQFTKNC